MSTTRRNCSFIFGGIAAIILISVFIFLSPNAAGIGAGVAIGICAYTLVSCLILDNNIVGDVVGDILSWGFVNLPGVIFTLDLEGLIWLLTVKLLFWILGFILAIICGILGIIIGGIVSLFVYPYAIVKSFKPENEVQ